MYIEDFQSQAIDNTPKIRVVVRKRPLSDKELRNKDYDIVEVRGRQTVVVREQRTKVDLTKYTEEHCFNFDRAFDERTSNENLYHDTVRPLVECLFQRAKVTCFAYGQTGSGKTFTMMGETKPDRNGNTVPGLYLLASRDIFSLLEQPCFQNLSIYVSFYEIYCGKLHDLLNEKQQLFAREDAKQNVNIVGLAEKKVTNVNSLLQIIDLGNSLRTTSKTSANDGSSRSHAILQIALKDGKKPYGKMSFIDLAGSERGADVNETSKQTRKDGAEINKSLLALKECIRALDQDKKHTPFRGSKLTLVLKDSFTGNCKTVMIGNFSPGILSCEHTLNTLRYADRVKELKKPTGDDDAPKSQSDILAKQLMLPRISKNTTKIAAPQSDDDEDEPSNNTSFNASFQSAKPPVSSVTKKNNNNGHQKNSLAAQNQKQFNNNNNNQNNYSQPASQQQKSMPYQSNSLFTKDTRKSSPYDMYTEGLFNMNNNNNSLTINPNSLTMPPNSYTMPPNSLTLPPNGLTLQPDLMNNVFNYRNNFQQQQQQDHNNSFQKKGGFFGQAQPQPQSSFTISPNEYLSQLNSMYKTSPFNKENYYSSSASNNFNPFTKFQDLQPQSRQQQQAQTQNSFKSQQAQPVSRESSWNNKQTSNSTQQQAANNDIYVKVEEGSQPRQTSNAMKLVNLVIMEEQEEMARIHKQYVAGMSDVMKNEYHLLKEITDPLTDPKEYISGVEEALTHQMELISVMRASLNKFKDKLKEEEDFNNKFMNIFDSNRMDNFKSEELMLLDDLA